MGTLADKQLARIDRLDNVLRGAETGLIAVGLLVTFYRWGVTDGLSLAQREFSEGFMDAATGSEGE